MSNMTNPLTFYIFIFIIIIIDRRFVRQTEAPIKNHEIFPGAPHKAEHQVFHDISIQDSIS